MVPNPIYDGPMYESIHQQLSDVTHSPSAEDITNTDSLNADSPSKPLYIVYPSHSCNTPVAKIYENMNATPTTVRAPPTYATPKTSKERNKLQLTLHLNTQPSETTSGVMLAGDSSEASCRLERGRRDTEGGYDNVPLQNDNYTTLSRSVKVTNGARGTVSGEWVEPELCGLGEFEERTTSS